MGAQRGQDMLLKISDGGSFITVAGLRSRSISLSAASVDVTTGESPERWRELLGDAGVRRAAISGSGIFADSTGDERLRTAFFGTGTSDFQLVIPDFGTLEGPFHILALDYTGNHDGAVSFDLSLESAGQISFTAAL